MTPKELNTATSRFTLVVVQAIRAYVPMPTILQLIDKHLGDEPLCANTFKALTQELYTLEPLLTCS